MTTLRRVLVVDDDPVVAKSFDRVLSTKGYAVVTAQNGEEALRKIAAEEYDVVYADIRMPGMDGIEVAERIRGGSPWLPVVIVTGYGTAENEARAKAAGVHSVLHKPLSPAMIEDSAREVLTPRPFQQTPALLQPSPAGSETAKRGSVAKTIGLTLAAPFLGLAFAVAFPLVGLGMLAKYGAEKAFKERARIFGFVKNVTLFLAAPFVGLLYAAMFPLIGLSMLAWTAMKARGMRLETIKAGLKTAGMIVAAPALGLIYAIALPVIGLGFLCWMGGKHLFTGK